MSPIPLNKALDILLNESEAPEDMNWGDAGLTKYSLGTVHVNFTKIGFDIEIEAAVAVGDGNSTEVVTSSGHTIKPGKHYNLYSSPSEILPHARKELRDLKRRLFAKGIQENETDWRNKYIAAEEQAERTFEHILSHL